jgi:hypothetical protein
MTSVFMLSVCMLNVVMLNVFMLIVFMLSVVMLNVVAPIQTLTVASKTPTVASNFQSSSCQFSARLKFDGSFLWRLDLCPNDFRS